MVGLEDVIADVTNNHSPSNGPNIENATDASPNSENQFQRVKRYLNMSGDKIIWIPYRGTKMAVIGGLHIHLRPDNPQQGMEWVYNYTSPMIQVAETAKSDEVAKNLNNAWIETANDMMNRINAKTLVHYEGMV